MTNHSRVIWLVLAALALPLAAVAYLLVDSIYVWDARLTVDETLFLKEIRPVRSHSGPVYHYYNMANPGANPDLRKAFIENRRPRHRQAIPLILGYTGTDVDAELLIDWLKELGREFQKDPTRVVETEHRVLASIVRSLGLMGRRGVKPARQFLGDFVDGKFEQQITLRWYNDRGDATMSFAFIGYAYLEPIDL